MGDHLDQRQLRGYGRREDDIFQMTIGQVAPDFHYQSILDGSGQMGEQAEITGRICQVYGSATRMEGRAAAQGQIVTAYFVDVTESQRLKELYEATRPVVCELVLDNYEEIIKAGGEAGKSSVLAQVDEKINNWVKDTGGLLKKYDRDRYLYVCDEQVFSQLVAEKFSILEAVHQVSARTGSPPHLHRRGEGLRHLPGGLPLGGQVHRDGPQPGRRPGGGEGQPGLPVLRRPGQEHGEADQGEEPGHGQGPGDLIADATQVYVMGHEYADMDARGRRRGHLLRRPEAGEKGADRHRPGQQQRAAPGAEAPAAPEYEGVFISGPDAFLHAQPGALLVVVDTNRPDMVENRQLLDSCNRVAVIDHHRRAATYIENAALNFHEPYASSASELVTELLQYMVEGRDLLRVEAEALLAGIVLDTKNFMMRTGGRTFEAAAFLRRAGAETSEVRRYFQSDLPSMIQRYDIIREAKLYHGDIAIAVVTKEVPRVTAAKAADDLLTLQGSRPLLCSTGPEKEPPCPAGPWWRSTSR